MNKQLKKFMEKYNAYQIYKEFEKFISSIEKKDIISQMNLIKGYMKSKSGTEKSDLTNLFIGYLQTKPFYHRKSDKEITKEILAESVKKNIVFAYGRMNPPTIGHSKLIEDLIKEAKKNNAEPRLYLSLSQDSDKNPLSPKEKQKYIKSVYKNLDVRIDCSNAYDVMDKLSKENIGNVILLTGEDQLAGYKRIAKYVNSGDSKSYNVDSFEAKSIGKRNDSAHGIEGVSASKVRSMIKEDKPLEKIKEVLLKGLSDKYIKEIIDKIK